MIHSNELWTCAVTSGTFTAAATLTALLLLICKANVKSVIAIALLFGLSIGSCAASMEVCPSLSNGNRVNHENHEN